MMEGSGDRLPRLVLIADGYTSPGRHDVVLKAAEGGVPWIHLRDHEASGSIVLKQARILVQALQNAGSLTRISVNSHLEVARGLNLDFHTGRHGPTVKEARTALGEEALIGVSVHDRTEARAARRAGADYAFISPVFPTSSKPDHPGIGSGGLRAVIEDLRPASAFALGGITPDRVAACLEAGSEGVAVLSGIMNASDPAQAVRDYLRAINNALN